MVVNCEHCGRSFSRQANLQRHMEALHPTVANESDDESESSGEDNQDLLSNEAAEEQMSFEEETPNDDGSDTDDGASSDGDEDRKRDQSVESDQSIESGQSIASDQSMESLDGNDYWDEMIGYATKFVEYEEPKDLLHEPQLSEMVDEIRKAVTARVKFANYMENDDEIISQIQKAVNRHEVDGTDEEAAVEAGWLDKRVLIKREIKKRLADIANDESDSDEESDEASGESEEEHEGEEESAAKDYLKMIGQPNII